MLSWFIFICTSAQKVEHSPWPAWRGCPGKTASSKFHRSRREGLVDEIPH